MSTVKAKVTAKAKDEPAVVVGALATLFAELANVAVGHDWQTFAVAAIPAVSSFVIRWFVQPAPEEQRGL